MHGKLSVRLEARSAEIDFLNWMDRDWMGTAETSAEAISGARSAFIPLVPIQRGPGILHGKPGIVFRAS